MLPIDIRTRRLQPHPSRQRSSAPVHGDELADAIGSTLALLAELLAAAGQHAERARFARAAAVLRAPAPRLAEATPLTARERDVAALVAQGLRNQQIGEQLVVAERTVEVHVSHALAKLDLTSRAQLAVWAVQHGLLTPGGGRAV